MIPQQQFTLKTNKTSFNIVPYKWCKYGALCIKQATTCTFLHPSTKTAIAHQHHQHQGGAIIVATPQTLPPPRAVLLQQQQQVVRSVQTVVQKPCSFGINCNRKATGCPFAHPIVVGTVAKPADVMALFVVDISGSMSGSKINDATDGMQLVVKDAMKPRDVVAVHTFNSSVAVVQKFARNGSVDYDALSTAIRASCGGMTALYDAVCTSIDALKQLSQKQQDKYPDQIRVLVLLTDGHDTSSTRTLTDAIAAVANPGIRDFHFVLLGVGLDSSTQAALRDQLCAPKHALYIAVQDAASDAIRAAFGTVTKKILQLKQLKKTVVTTTTTTTTTSAALAAVATASTSAATTSRRRLLKVSFD